MKTAMKHALQPSADEIATVLRHRPPEFVRLRGCMCDENGLSDVELDHQAAFATVAALKGKAKGAAE